MTKNIRKILTHNYIENLKNIEDLKISDPTLPGFYLKYSAITGLKVFCFKFRVRGFDKQYLITIGRYPEFRITEAKNTAQEYRYKAVRGINPIIEFREVQKEIEATEEKRLTIKEAINMYMEEYSKLRKKPLTVEMDYKLIRLYINPKIGNMILTEVKHTHINKLVLEVGTKKHYINKRIKNGSPAMANSCKSLLSHFMNWSEDEGYKEFNTNPCRRVKKFKLNKRDRVLSNEEYRKIFNAIEEGMSRETYSPSSFEVIKLLLFTGCRLSECKNLQRKEVDLDNCLLRLEDSKTGKKSVPIGKIAVEIIREAMSKYNSEYVFPSTKMNDKPWADLKKPWNFVKKFSGISDICIHDIRHSFATMGVLAGVGMEKMSKILGHSSITTTQIYTHTTSMDAISSANAISDAIEGVINNCQILELKTLAN